jgi:hypothetical protein
LKEIGAPASEVFIAAFPALDVLTPSACGNFV